MEYLFHLLKFPEIYRNPFRTEEEIIERQRRGLKRLVAFAYQNVPFYRYLMDSLGIRPQEIASIDDLPRLPILTKDQIRNHYPDGILAENIDWRKCSRRMTSGSSGKKLEVVLDHEEAALYRLMQLRQWLAIGYKPWDQIAYVRFSPPVTRLNLQKISLFRRHFIPLEWTPERQLDEIFKLKPRIVNAYPSVLFLLAKALNENRPRGLKFKFLLSNSELLTAHARGYIEDAFGCKVYDDYSCLEFSAIGFECRFQQLHVASDNVILEIVDDSGRLLPRGNPGRIILTALNNFSMPYLRYEIGDAGALTDEKCPCGQNFPVLKSILGRCDDFVVLPSGEAVDPQTVVFQIEDLPEVKEFRVFQGEDFGLQISIIPRGGAEWGEIESRIRRRLNGLLPGIVRIDFKRVDHLDRGTTGKHRSIISLLQTKKNAKSEATPFPESNSGKFLYKR
jgi:phenylacetate-CoA ligase